MNESWDALETLLQLLDAIWFSMKHNFHGYQEMRRQIWETTGNVQKEIDVACGTNEQILAAYNPLETAVCDIAASAATGVPVNFDAALEAIRKMPEGERPTLKDGTTLEALLEAENGGTISPAEAVRAIQSIGVERLAVDLQPIVRDFIASVDNGSVRSFDLAGRLRDQAEFLTGDHRNNPSDAILVAMIESYNNETPLKTDELMAYLKDHRDIEHEYATAIRTLAENSGKVVTAGQVKGFADLTGEHFSEDLMARVRPGIDAAFDAAKRGEKVKIFVLSDDERKAAGKNADQAEAETMAKLHKAFGVLAEGKGNAFYDPTTNAILDPAAAISSADEKLTPEEKKNGYQHVALAQYDIDERKALGFACAWANMRDNTNKTVEKIMASHRNEMQSTVERAASVARNYGCKDRHIHRTIDGLMKATLHYSIPGEPHPAELKAGDLTALASFKAQNSKLVDKVVEEEKKQKAAARQADINAAVDIDKSRPFGKINAVFAGEGESLDGMSEAETVAKIREAEQNLLTRIRNADPKAAAQIKDAANQEAGERAAYVNRNDPLVKAYPDLYAKAVALRDGDEHAGMTVLKTMDEYARGYAVWLVATANLYASERGPSAVASLQAMIQDKTALAMYAEYVRGQEPKSKADLPEYQKRCNDAVALLASGDALEQIDYVRKVETKIDGYCSLHQLSEQVSPSQYTETIANAYVYEPGVDRPIPLNEIRTPEQICSIASAMIDAGQEEQAMRFVENLSHRSLVEAQQMTYQNVISSKTTPVITRDDQAIVKMLTTNFKATTATLMIIGVYEAESLRRRGETLSSVVAKRVGDKITPELTEKLNQLSARAAETVAEAKQHVEKKKENDVSLQRTRED